MIQIEINPVRDPSDYEGCSHSRDTDDEHERVIKIINNYKRVKNIHVKKTKARYAKKAKTKTIAKAKAKKNKSLWDHLLNDDIIPTTQAGRKGNDTNRNK
jgi:hypothetical protein